MNKENYLKDISEIKELMNKSSKFISLSGLSGIMAGIYALLGAGYAYWLVSKSPNKEVIINSDLFYSIITILLIVLVVSVTTSVFLTSKKAKKENVHISQTPSKSLLVNFSVPLFTGGIFLLFMYNKQEYAITGALMLIFYGLALVNASKNTVFDWKNLGYVEIFLGLLSVIFPKNAFWFWVLGFGVLHIIYGVIMYFKHEKNASL